MSEKAIIEIAGRKIESSGSIPVDEKMEALNDNLNILWDSPMIFARGKYTDTNGKTWDFEKMGATEISALLLMGQISQMEIKTWSENE